MAITTEAGLIASRAGARFTRIQKSSVATATAGLTGLFVAAGAAPSSGAAPAAAAVCTSATPGAIALPITPVGGNTLYIDAVSYVNSVACQFEVVDRLVHSGGLNATLTTAQAVNTPALPGRASPALCAWYLEVYTAIGATITTAVVAVTHTDATTANINVVTLASAGPGRKMAIIPTAGKVIASVQSVTLATTTGVAGNFGAVCEQPVGVRAGISLANLGAEYESLIRSIPGPDACLSLNVFPSTTTTGNIEAGLVIMQG